MYKDRIWKITNGFDRLVAEINLIRFVVNALYDMGNGVNPRIRYGCTPSHISAEYKKELIDAFNNAKKAYSKDKEDDKLYDALIEWIKNHFDRIEKQRLKQAHNYYL